VAEVQALAAKGLLEANLVSQDTIAYGRDLDGRPTLARLLRDLGDIEELAWIRVHYLYPETLKDELVDLFRDHPKVLPYIDMPLQHASDSMLRRMRRGHGGDRLRRVVDKLRSRIPNMVFRSTFIVGHPGETDDDFEELCRFIEWAEFDHVGVFTYSHEEGTHAGDMEDLVPDKVAAARRNSLMALQGAISRKKLRSHIGQELEVLVEGPSEESDFLFDGRFWGQAPEVDGKIILANGEATAGTFRKAVVRDAAEYDLVADLVGEGGDVDLPPGIERVRLPTVS
ncbi:MAG: radical SAM protein, partial [Myxococcales bacterium]|nr:radical SAM protein [Myxococcales bacterium]